MPSIRLFEKLEQEGVAVGCAMSAVEGGGGAQYHCLHTSKSFWPWKAASFSRLSLAGMQEGSSSFRRMCVGGGLMCCFSYYSNNR